MNTMSIPIPKTLRVTTLKGSNASFHSQTLKIICSLAYKKGFYTIESVQCQGTIRARATTEYTPPSMHRHTYFVRPDSEGFVEGKELLDA